MTTVLYEPDVCRLRVDGHAEAAVPVDPVCAGVSALAWALVEAATERDAYRAELFFGDGIIEVCCRPGDEDRDMCRYMFEVVMAGLRLIAEMHPENVRIKTGGQ